MRDQTKVASELDPRLTYWLVVGDQWGWGRSDKSEKQAIASMNRNGVKKATRYSVYRCTPNTTINGSGFIVRPEDDPAAVHVRSFPDLK